MCAGNLLCFQGEVFILKKEREDALCATLFRHKIFTMSRRRMIEHAATKYLSPTDVEEFRTVVLEAGTRLASLLAVEYPSADLVSDALYVVMDAVECYSLKGKWVTSWASSAKNVFGDSLHL